jgi:hypothetical protein
VNDVKPFAPLVKPSLQISVQISGPLTVFHQLSSSHQNNLHSSHIHIKFQTLHPLTNMHDCHVGTVHNSMLKSTKMEGCSVV